MMLGDDMRHCSKKFIMEVIELYKTLPCLWQVKASEFRNKNARDRAFEVLTNKFKEVERRSTKALVIAKINSLKSNFRRELRKVQKSIESGAKADDIYKPQLWYYDLLTFLVDQETPTESLCSFDEISREDDQHFQEDYGILETLLKEEDLGCLEDDADGNLEDTSSNAESAPTASYYAAERSSVRVRPTARKRPANSTAQHNNKTEPPVVSKLQRLSDFYREDDEFDLFGKSIAVQLRNMPLERALICQETLQAVMKQERLYQLHHLS